MNSMRHLENFGQLISVHFEAIIKNYNLVLEDTITTIGREFLLVGKNCKIMFTYENFPVSYMPAYWF